MKECFLLNFIVRIIIHTLCDCDKKLGVSLRNVHIWFSNDGNIERVIAILREILGNNCIEYHRKKLESQKYPSCINFVKPLSQILQYFHYLF